MRKDVARTMYAMSRTIARKRAGARKPHLSRLANLCESYAGSTRLRVDRASGVIYGVKVLGKTSPNTHGKSNVTGTDYLANSHHSLVGLIESETGGMRVNKNHTERANPNRDRTVSERIGWLENPRVEAGETYADFHVLKEDPDAAKLFEAAERNPHCFAMSINADGHYEIKDGRLQIDKFVRVKSVDVVADGGSTVSLAESKQAKGKPMKILEALEAVKLSKKQIVKLFEMESPLLKPGMDMPAEPEEGSEEEENYEAHLGKAVVAILHDETLDQEAKKKKILAILKLTGDEESSGEATVDAEESDDEGGGDDDAPLKDDDDEDKKPMTESLEAKVARLERRDHIRTLCETKQYTPSEKQLKTLSLTESDEDAKELIDTFKLAAGAAKTTDKKKGTGPVRSSAGTTSVKESLTVKDAAEQAKLLLAR